MRSRLLPVISRCWEGMSRPHRMVNQNFGTPIRPEAFINSSFREFDNVMREMERDMREMERDIRWLNRSFFEPSYRNRELTSGEENGWSEIKDDKDKFHVALNVKHFKPEEINVKVVDDWVVVEGKHEEKDDDHGTIARHFVRKYMIPEQCEADKTTCALSPDGILSISAPRKPELEKKSEERQLKIEYVHKPEQIENSKEEQPKEKERMNAKN